MERTREQQMHDVNMGMPFESVHLTAFGKDRGIYFEILEDGNLFILDPSKQTEF